MTAYNWNINFFFEEELNRFPCVLFFIKLNIFEMNSEEEEMKKYFKKKMWYLIDIEIKMLKYFNVGRNFIQ